MFSRPNCATVVQDLRPKGQDVRKEELGYMVDKEMIATSTAIEEAVLRMDVRMRSFTSHHPVPHTDSAHPERVLFFCFFSLNYAGDHEPS